MVTAANTSTVEKKSAQMYYVNILRAQYDDDEYRKNGFADGVTVWIAIRGAIFFLLKVVLKSNCVTFCATFFISNPNNWIYGEIFPGLNLPLLVLKDRNCDGLTLIFKTTSYPAYCTINTHCLTKTQYPICPLLAAVPMGILNIYL